MYSAPFSLLPSRAANFLLLGYTNCSISILYWAAAGSWGSTRHRWPVQAIVITTPQRACILFVWVFRMHAASVLTAFILFFLHLILTPLLTGSYFLVSLQIWGVLFDARPPVDLASHKNDLAKFMFAKCHQGKSQLDWMVVMFYSIVHSVCSNIKGSICNFPKALLQSVSYSSRSHSTDISKLHF